MARNLRVLIIGAGPAGVSAAYFLKYYDSDNTVDVNLVERLDSKRYEIYHDMCGCAISENLLKEIKPLKVENIVGKIHLIREFWPDNLVTETRLKGYIIDRPEFLKAVIRRFVNMGGEFEVNSVNDITQYNDKVKVKFSTGRAREYDYVIAADGANPIVRKKLNIGGKRDYFVQYVIDEPPERGVLCFYYDEKYKGDYMWKFPSRNKTKIGFPMFLEREQKSLYSNKKIVTRQVRAIGYGGLDKYCVGRILLIGDAACQANAITKGGIRPAMVAGRIAAQSIIGNDPAGYTTRWKRTRFSSKIFVKAHLILRQMDNKALSEHIKPFCKEISFPYYVKFAVFKRKYITLYRAYRLANDLGW